jgi:trk system potassium uptake protein TrkH
VGPASRRRLAPRHPAQILVASFLCAAAIGTLLLMLPVSRTGAGGAPWATALFTATSAVCVTGLTTVDTATYWSTTGQVVILGLIQVGGFGIMTLASLIALALTRRIGLRTRLTAAAETRSVGPGDVRRVLRGVFLVTAVVESVVSVVLALRFRTTYDDSWGAAGWHGVFHAVSAFNNAGFALFSDNLMGFLTDGFVLLPISVAVVLGGLGFPVLVEVLRNRRLRTWSLHTRLTLLMTAALLVGGTAFITLSEWGNPGTVGSLGPADKVLAGWFHAVQPRTAGFNAWNYADVTDGTLLGTILLMFIGGGSAGTAGGLKVTTFIVLFLVIVAEVRGDDDVIAFDRRINHRVVRQATTVALLGVAAVVGGTMLLTQLTHLPLRDVVFETTSAFATVGLSTGITPRIAQPGQLVLVALMFLGRLGPITLVSALALREHNRRYRFPEGAPLIG